LGVTQKVGVRYFDFQPARVKNLIEPSKPAKNPNPTLSYGWIVIYQGPFLQPTS